MSTFGRTIGFLAAVAVATLAGGCLVDATDSELDDETDTATEELPLNQATFHPRQLGNKSLKKLTIEVETVDRLGGPAPPEQQNGDIDGAPHMEPDPEPWRGDNQGKD